MKLKTKVRTLIATTLLALGSQLFAAETTINLGVADGNTTVGDSSAVPVSGTNVTYADFFGLTIPTDTGTVNSVNLTASGTDYELDGAIDGKAFTAIFTVEVNANNANAASPSTDYTLGINEFGQVGPLKGTSVYINGGNEGPFTFTFKEMKTGSHADVSFVGFTTVAATSGNGAGAALINTASDNSGGTQIGVVNRPNFSPVDVSAITDTDSKLKITYKNKSWVVLQIGMKFTDIVVGDVELDNVNQFDAVTLPDGGTTDDNLTFANWAAIQAVLPTKLTETTTGLPAIDVTWADTDNYGDGSAVTANTYTFTGTIGSTIEAGFKDDVLPNVTGLTVTTTLTVSAPAEITSYDQVNAPFAGSSYNPVFADETAVSNAIGALTANYDGGTVSVPATWTSSPAYDPNTADTYTFSATTIDIPPGYVDNSQEPTPTVLVTITDVDFSTTQAKLENGNLGKDGIVTWNRLFSTIPTTTNGPESATGTIAIRLEEGTVNAAVYEVSLTVTAQGEGTATNPKLRFRFQNGSYFIGVSSDANEGSIIAAEGDPASPTYREGLKWTIDSIKTGGVDADEAINLGIKSFQMGNADANEIYEFLTDVDPITPVVNTGNVVTFGAAPFADGLFPTVYANHFSNPKANQNSPSYDFSKMFFDFGYDVPTPALGVALEQTGTLVEWSVEEEISVDFYQLIDAEGNVIAVIYADGSETYSITLDSDVEVKLVVVDKNGKASNPYSPDKGNEVEGNYSLTEGWNLISVPGENADLSAIEAATIGTLWGWDGSKYVETDAQAAYTGIWVYSDKAQTVSATATKSVTTLELQPGWTLAGPANTVKVPETVTVFEWNGTYTPTVSLDNGKGYWFFAPEVTTITLDSE